MLHEVCLADSYFDMANEIIIAISGDEIVTEINRKGCEVLGYQRQEVIGKNWFDKFLPEKTRDELRPRFHEMLEGIVRLERYENPVLTREGSERIISWHNMLIRDQTGEVAGVLSSGDDVTDLKKTEEEIKSLARFPSENPNPVLRVNRDGRLLYVNERARTLCDMWNCVVGENLPENVTVLVNEALQTGLKRETEIGVEGRILSLVYAPIEGECYVNIYGTDITDRKKAEEALLDSEDHFRDLYENAPNAYFSIGADGRIRRCNRRTGELLGYAVEELVGKPVLELYAETPNGKKKAAEVLERSRAGETVRDEQLEMQKADGNSIWINLSLSPGRDTEGRIIEIRSIAVDITERRRTEELLSKRTRELEETNNELQQFTYVASHDLREPLRMITSFSQSLEKRYKDKLDKTANEYIGFVVDAAARMQNLIDDLLVYSRVGTRGLPFEPVDMEKTLRSTLANLKMSIEETKTRISHDSLPIIQADSAQMMQVLQNLLDNAIKFRREEEAPAIHLSARREGEEWVFSVKDNGIGIAPELFGRLFILFQALHTRNEYPGTGVGLAIAKRIVQRHGGRIWVESQPGKGSTFYFSIPFRTKQ